MSTKPRAKPGGSPPRPLGKHGANLWAAVTHDYRIVDAGGVEILAQACAALDRAEALREAIDRDGLIVTVGGAPKDHPAIKHELANRAFVCRAIQRLGLDVEAVKPIGRPPSRGWEG